jgi:hypothetical protein
MKTFCVWLLLFTGSSIGWNAFAQIRSATLSIQTHCPYGIKGCWPEIRDGLESPPEILSISKGPDTKTGTCEVLMRESWVPDPDFFAHNFTNMHIGVDVRGVEVVAEGWVEKKGANLVMHVPGRNVSILLTPITRKVQWDANSKEPEAILKEERAAFGALSRKSLKGKFMQITGPLRKSTGIPANGCKLILEVRKFKILKQK